MAGSGLGRFFFASAAVEKPSAIASALAQNICMRLFIGDLDCRVGDIAPGKRLVARPSLLFERREFKTRRV
jgi:hypothetical protein